MSLLPHNATALERALEHACDHNIDAQIIRGVANSVNCPAHFLPWLGWAMKVDGWEAADSEQQQRELIREAIPVHKSKGTVGAVRRVLKAVGVNAEVEEWQQVPGAAPYTFRLTAWANDNRQGEGTILSPQLAERLRALVDAAKNERSHYDFRLGARFDGGWRLANATRARSVVRQSVEAQGVPVHPESGLLVASAIRFRIIVRGTMEAVS